VLKCSSCYAWAGAGSAMLFLNEAGKTVQKCARAGGEPGAEVRDGAWRARYILAIVTRRPSRAAAGSAETRHTPRRGSRFD